MKTSLPLSITTIEQAKAFLKELYDNDEAFHPDDDAHDIGDTINGEWVDLFTFEEAEEVNKRFEWISELKDFDPSEYLLELNGRVLVLVNHLSNPN